MRLLVLGTSNSILKGGYVEALRGHPEIQSCDRVGPGGSTSIMLPFFGAEVDFSAYDALIVDTSVNDGAFMGWNLLARSEVLDNIRWICSTALQAGVTPVLLCMPNRNYLEVPDPALSAYRQVAEELHVPLLDGYGFARAQAVFEQKSVAEIFMDDLHLRPEIATRLAPELVEYCRRRHRRQVLPFAPGFRRILASELGLPLRRRQTSLLTTDCAVLSKDDRLEIPLSPEEALAGIVYNAGHSFGTLICAGRNAVGVNMRSHYFQKNDLVAAARQISPASWAQEGLVRVHMQYGQPDGAEIIGFLVSIKADPGPDGASLPSVPDRP